MIFGRIACLGVLVFLSFAIRAAYAGECLFGGPHYQLQSDSVEWRMEIRSGHSCIQGVRFNNVAIHSINLAFPPQSGRVTLLGSAFEYTAKPDFQGDHSFAVGVSGAIRGMSGTSTIRIAVSVVVRARDQL